MRNVITLEVPGHGRYSTTHSNLIYQLGTTTAQERRDYLLELHNDDVHLQVAYAMMAQPLIDVIFADCNRQEPLDSYDRG